MLTHQPIASVDTRPTDALHTKIIKNDPKKFGSCIRNVRASTVEYQLIPWIDTSNPPSINTPLASWLTLDWHSMDILVDSQQKIVRKMHKTQLTS